ncbi:unnamed protein product [Malus baccata var. baccata]
MLVFISNFSPLKLKLIAKLSSAYFRLFDSNMLISNTTAVICLDDYHSLDMTWRKEKEVTMLDPRATDFDLMYKQMKAIKEGKAVEKPIYTMFLVAWILLSSSSSPKILVIEVGCYESKEEVAKRGEVIPRIKQVPFSKG